MKPLACIFLLLLTTCLCGQTNDQANKWKNNILDNPDLYKQEFKRSLAKYNFGPLWTNTNNSLVYGFIGENYQRIRLKILSAKKSKSNLTYTIAGKSMVKNNISKFDGTITITALRVFKNKHWGMDNEFRNKGIKKQGILVAEFHFAEENIQPHSGTFDGILLTSWYIDKNRRVKYDDIEKNSDSYCNNQFAGAWKQYKTTEKKTCNWGDYRIPLSGDLDQGAGEFSPAEKYLQNGWQTYHEAYANNNRHALQEEKKQWWK